MKRYLVAFGAAGLVFAGVYGSAAALDVNGGAVQAGSDATLQCDDTGVEVASYRIDAEPPAVSSGVRITGIDTRCAGEELFATVSDGNGDALADGLVDLTDSGTATVSWGAEVPIEAIEKIDLAID